VLDIPLLPRISIVSGLAGIQPDQGRGRRARALSGRGRHRANGAWLRGSPDRARFTGQRYDFSNGELTTTTESRAA